MVEGDLQNESESEDITEQPDQPTERSKQHTEEENTDNEQPDEEDSGSDQKGEVQLEDGETDDSGASMLYGLASSTLAAVLLTTMW